MALNSLAATVRRCSLPHFILMCIHMDYTLRFACVDATVRSAVLLPVKLLTV